jgi:hypothetical protein
VTVLKYSHSGPYSSDRFTYNFTLLPSKRELLRNQLVQEFSAVQEENGYRTTPYEVRNILPVDANDIKSHPILCVLVGEEEWEFNDTNRTVLSSFIKCQVWGYYADVQGSGGLNVYAAESAGEPLIDDMKRVLSRLLLKNVNTTGFRWLVSLNPRPRITGPMYYQANRGAVILTFTVKVIYQSVDL